MIKYWIVLLIGNLANKIKVPGCVQPMEFTDQVTGNRVVIKNSPYYTKLSISGRDYYFNRFSGKFDGTGMGCVQPETPHGWQNPLGDSK